MKPVTSVDTEALKILLDAFVQMQRLSTEPGDKSYRLWHSTQFLEREIRKILKRMEAT